MDEFFQTIREACSSKTWSKAVELVRIGTFAATQKGDAVVVNINSAESAVQPIATLFVEDQDWQCTCSSAENPCHHVAAAIIAIRRAREKGQDLPKAAEDVGRLQYQFHTENHNLLLKRIIVQGTATQPLTTTLSALTSGRVKGPKLLSTPSDMEIDVLLGAEKSGQVALKNIPALLRHLKEGACEVLLNGRKAQTNPEAIGLALSIDDDGPGVRITARKHPSVDMLFSNGYATTKNQDIHPAIIPEKTPLMEKIFKAGAFYGRQEFGELVGHVLPQLLDRYPVHINSRQLPKQGYSKPRIELELIDKYPEGLAVSCAIVYGDPIDTRIFNGKIENFGGRVAKRSIDEELILKDDLWRQFNLEMGPTVILPPVEAWKFIEKIGRFKGDVIGEGYFKWRVQGELSPSIDWEDDLPRFSFHAGKSKSDKSASSTAVVNAWNKGEGLVRLDGGGFARIPEAWLEEHRELLAWMHAPKGEKKIGNAAKISIQKTAQSLGVVAPSSLSDLRKRFEKISEQKLKTPPLKADLRAYQAEGITWLHTLAEGKQGGILADDMGLGKTLQAMSLLKFQSLVVAPTSVVYNWKREIERFRPELKICLFHGKDRVIDEKADVVVTSYNLVRLSPQTFAREWRIVIADEAQFIKNPESQIFSVMCDLKADARFALSGTPVENRLDDLWAQMEFANPGLLGGRKYFNEQISSRIVKGDDLALENLRSRIKPYFLRRLKTEVATDLPPRTNIVRTVELSEQEKTLYSAILQKTRESIETIDGEKTKSGLHVLELLLRLRQACCHPNLLPDTKGYESAKVNYAAELIESLVENKHKILVFSQWTSYLDLIEGKLRELNLTNLRLDGSTINRQDIVDKFQNKPEHRILLMSLKAGGTGLNLTAADHVFIMDPWWNPAAEEQASNRAWRIGQDKPVFVHKLVASGTIEEKIIQLQESKQKLSDSVAGGDFAEAPTTKEILELLKD